MSVSVKILIHPIRVKKPLNERHEDAAFQVNIWMKARQNSPIDLTKNFGFLAMDQRTNQAFWWPILRGAMSNLDSRCMYQ
jgi:hypothetical protein